MWIVNAVCWHYRKRNELVYPLAPADLQSVVCSLEQNILSIYNVKYLYKQLISNRPKAKKTTASAN